MAIDLGGPVTGLVAAALNASVMRHDAIANNIANINTPGYKPMQVSFEDQLRGIMSKDMLQDDEALKAELASIKPVFYQSGGSSGTGQLDVEMVNLSKNTLHYHTLLQALKGYGAITKMAIKEGKT